MSRCHGLMAGGLLLMATAIGQSPPSPDAARIYATRCVSCHGAEMQGGQGPSLLPGAYTHGSDAESITRSIAEGHPEKGMPGWGATLTEAEIRSLAQFLKRQPDKNSPQYLAALDQAQITSISSAIFRTEREAYRLKVVARLGQAWGMAFLPDGRLLVTEAQGKLRLVEKGRLNPIPIVAVPFGHPQDRFRRALLDVAVHPGYRSNGWIYLTYGDSVHAPDGKLLHEVVLVRGRLKDNSWVDSETLVRIPAESTVTGRIAFDGQRHLYLTTASDAGVSQAIGVAPIALEKLLKSPPQDLNDPNGKILRYNDDGSIPSDNPFAATPGAFTAIWSYGNRNPEGLAVNPATGELWSSEHGPRGGDELNLILGGHNYGWPVLSYGTRDDGSPISPEIQHEGMDAPVINWTPEIAVSAIAFYEGSEFPRWCGNLLIGSLVQKDLIRVMLSGHRAVLQEAIVGNLGRIRAIAVGPKGEIYVALELRLGGLIVRLVSLAPPGPSNLRCAKKVTP